MAARGVVRVVDDRVAGVGLELSVDDHDIACGDGDALGEVEVVVDLDGHASDGSGDQRVATAATTAAAAPAASAAIGRERANSHGRLMP